MAEQLYSTVSLAQMSAATEPAADGAGAAPAATRRRRNSTSFKRGVHGLDDVVGGSIERADVQFRGALHMISGALSGAAAAPHPSLRPPSPPLLAAPPSAPHARWCRAHP